MDQELIDRGWKNLVLKYGNPPPRISLGEFSTSNEGIVPKEIVERLEGMLREQSAPFEPYIEIMTDLELWAYVFYTVFSTDLQRGLLPGQRSNLILNYSPSFLEWEEKTLERVNNRLEELRIANAL